MLNHSTNASLPTLATESEIRLFLSVPGNNLLLQANPPHFTMLAVTDSYAKETGRSREELLGKGLFEVFPANPNDPSDTGENDLRFSLSQVIHHKKAHHLPTQRYDVSNANSSFEERYWNACNTPVLDDKGGVKFIIHNAVDITHQLVAKQKDERLKLLEQSHTLFEQAPVAIAILTGKDLVVEIANTMMIDIWGRKHDITGKPIHEVFPVLESERSALMKNVVETEKTFWAYEMPLTVRQDDASELRYFNIVYQPCYVKEKVKPVGIIVFANDVTEQVQSKLKTRESEQRVRALVESAPFPIGVYVGREMRIDLANQTILDIWEKATM